MFKDVSNVKIWYARRGADRKKAETGTGSTCRYAGIFDTISEDKEDSGNEKSYLGFVKDKKSGIVKMVENSDCITDFPVYLIPTINLPHQL